MLSPDTVYCIMRNDSIFGNTHLCGVFLDGHEANEIFDTIVNFIVKKHKEELGNKNCIAKDSTADYYPNFIRATTININEDVWELIWIERRKLNRYII